MNTKMNIKDFSHPQLNRPIVAIGGNYVFTKEYRLTYHHDDVLVLVGCAIFDTTCCGAGGCSYAIIPGMIRQWKYKTDENQFPVSAVEPIQDPLIQNRLRRMVMKNDSVLQVQFD